MLFLLNSCISTKQGVSTKESVVYYRQVDISIEYKLTLDSEGNYELFANTPKGLYTSRGQFNWNKNRLILSPKESSPFISDEKSWVTTKYELRNNSLFLKNGLFKKLIGSIALADSHL